MGSQVQKHINHLIWIGYLNKRNYISHIEEFIKYIGPTFGVRSLKNLSRKHINAYKEYLVTRGIEDSIIFDKVNSVLYIIIRVSKTKLNLVNRQRLYPMKITCPYCYATTRFLERRQVLNSGEGNIYICTNYPKCEAYVGVHTNSVVPLGSLANKKLRVLRKQCHYYFDRIYKQRSLEGYAYAKHKTYKWLSDNMAIPLDKTHIGMFGIEECRKAIDICKKSHNT